MRNYELRIVFWILPIIRNNSSISFNSGWLSCFVKPGLCTRIRDEVLTHNKSDRLVLKAWHEDQTKQSGWFEAGEGHNRTSGA